MADEKALNEQKSLMAAVSRKSRDSNEANNGGILIRTVSGSIQPFRMIELAARHKNCNCFRSCGFLGTRLQS